VAGLISGWLGGIAFVLNLLGSSGDILMALFLCDKPGCRILNRDYGFDILTRNIL